jgi:hypothetical protein
MPGLEYADGRYLIQLVPRTIEDILALDDGRQDEQAFEVVERVSRINQGLYDELASPLVKAASNEATAWTLRMMNPVRLERWLWSDLNPCMLWVKAMAELVRANRRPAPGDNPFLELEHKVSSHTEQALDELRAMRDDLQERTFKAIYESRWLALAVGAGSPTAGRGGPGASTWEREELALLKRKEVEASIETGTPLDAWARLLLYVRQPGDAGDERPFNMVRRMIDEMAPEHVPSLAALKAALKRQAFVLALDEERAMASLRKLAPETHLLRRGFDAARMVLSTRGELTPQQNERFRKAAIFAGLDGVEGAQGSTPVGAPA